MAATLNAVYCDDIRVEVGGKISLMGVYQSDMIFPQFPALVPKFCSRITLRFRVDERPRESLSIQLSLDEKEIGRLEIGKQQLDEQGLPPLDPAIPDEDRFLAIQTVLAFSPFQVEAPCRLRLRAYIDGNEIKGNGLKIREPTPEERISNGWSSEGPGLAA
jgi:hypothetical protein